MPNTFQYAGVFLLACAILDFTACGDAQQKFPTASESTALPAEVSEVSGGTGPVTTNHGLAFSSEEASAASSDSSSSPLTLKFVNDKMTWGSKYDSVSGSADQGIVCVDTAKMGYANNGNWQQGNVTVNDEWKVITTSIDLSSFFSINAHAKATVGVYGAGAEAGASAKAQFSESNVYGSYKAYALGWTKSLNSVDSLAIKDFYLAKHDNFTDFINDCGDYYLHQMQTGAELLMLMEIKATDVSAAASVSAGFSVEAQAVEAGGSVSAGFNADYANSEVDGQIFYSAPQGCGFSPPVVDTKDFAQTVKAIQTSGSDFNQKITSSCLEGSDSNQTPAYLGTFRQWTQDVWQAQRQDWVNRNKDKCPNGASSCGASGGGNTSQTAAIGQILDAFDQYQAILGDLDSMSLRPENYNWTNAAYQHGDLPQVERIIKGGASGGGTLPQVLAMAQACGADPTTCQWNPISPSPQDILNKLPVAIALPSSCADVALQSYGLALPDGVYPLYIDRNEEKPLCVYCYGMSGSNPREFLRLYQTSPMGKTVNNYSVKRNMYYHDSKKKKHNYNNMISTFNYLPLVSLRHGVVVIDSLGACNNYQDDNSLPFVENWYSGPQSNNPLAGGSPMECVPYGHGTHYQYGAKTELAKFSVVDVNMAGHPLAFDPNNTRYGVPAKDARIITYSNNQGVTLQVQSGEGGVSTNNNPDYIQFQYNRSLGDTGTGLACTQ